MPKYAVSPVKWEGAIHPPYDQMLVCDAEGRMIDKPIIYMDTDTGVVVSYIQVAGMTKQWKQGNKEGQVYNVTVHPAPLSVTPYMEPKEFIRVDQK